VAQAYGPSAGYDNPAFFLCGKAHRLVACLVLLPCTHRVFGQVKGRISVDVGNKLLDELVGGSSSVSLWSTHLLFLTRTESTLPAPSEA